MLNAVKEMDWKEKQAYFRWLTKKNVKSGVAARNWPVVDKTKSKTALRHLHQAVNKAMNQADVAPKFEKPRHHKPKEAIPPTWPKTPNQRKQSRPIIVLHPKRVIAQVVGKDAANIIWAAYANRPKWTQDTMARHI